jgi:uncharacterized protein YmfQ (DUF2313 family)
MLRPLRDATAYATELLGHLPSSEIASIWPRALTGVWGNLLTALGGEPARIDINARKLLDEMDPRTTVDMMPDWETAYGLPDPCTAPPTTIGDRRARLLTLVTMKGSLTPKFLTAMAYNIGIDVLVRTFAPARMGMTAMGGTLANTPWAFATRVYAPPVSARRMHMGVSYMGDRLCAFGNDPLQCVVRRHVRAVTLPRLVFSFNDPQTTLGAAPVWSTPGAPSGVSTALPARAAGATYFLVGTFSAEAFGGSDAAYGLIASSTRVAVGAAAGGDAPRVSLPIAPAGQSLISIVQTDNGGTRSISVRVNGAPIGTASAAGVGAIAGNMIAFTGTGLDLFGMKAWPVQDDELDWLERVVARQFNIKLAGWPVDLTQGV